MPVAAERRLQRPRHDFNARSRHGSTASVGAGAAASKQDANDRGSERHQERGPPPDTAPNRSLRTVARRLALCRGALSPLFANLSSPPALVSPGWGLRLPRVTA